MSDFVNLVPVSRASESVLHSPFAWCHVKGGSVALKDASHAEGTRAGIYQVKDFAIAQYPITNAQYERFLENPNGFSNTQWWEYSSEAIQWRKDHQGPKLTAFDGADLPRTHISWFDSMAFCQWLSAELNSNLLHENLPIAREITIRLPTEQEWQRAALGDTDWCYPWGEKLDETRGNYGDNVGQPSSVEKYPEGKSVWCHGHDRQCLGMVLDWLESGKHRC